MSSKNADNTFAKNKNDKVKKQSCEKPNAKTYPSFPHYQRTNPTLDTCWNGPNLVNRPKEYKTEKLIDSTDDSQKSGTSKQNPPTSIVKNPFN